MAPTLPVGWMRHSQWMRKCGQPWSGAEEKDEAGTGLERCVTRAAQELERERETLPQCALSSLLTWTYRFSYPVWSCSKPWCRISYHRWAAAFRCIFEPRISGRAGSCSCAAFGPGSSWAPFFWDQETVRVPAVWFSAAATRSTNMTRDSGTASAASGRGAGWMMLSFRRALTQTLSRAAGFWPAEKLNWTVWCPCPCWRPSVWSARDCGCQKVFRGSAVTRTRPGSWRFSVWREDFCRIHWICGKNSSFWYVLCWSGQLPASSITWGKNWWTRQSSPQRPHSHSPAHRSKAWGQKDRADRSCSTAPGSWSTKIWSRVLGEIQSDWRCTGAGDFRRPDQSLCCCGQETSWSESSGLISEFPSTTSCSPSHAWPRNGYYLASIQTARAHGQVKTYGETGEGRRQWGEAAKARCKLRNILKATSSRTADARASHTHTHTKISIEESDQITLQ